MDPAPSGSSDPVPTSSNSSTESSSSGGALAGLLASLRGSSKGGDFGTMLALSGGRGRADGAASGRSSRMDTGSGASGRRQTGDKSGDGIHSKTTAPDPSPSSSAGSAAPAVEPGTLPALPPAPDAAAEISLLGGGNFMTPSGESVGSKNSEASGLAAEDAAEAVTSGGLRGRLSASGLSLRSLGMAGRNGAPGATGPAGAPAKDGAAQPESDSSETELAETSAVLGANGATEATGANYEDVAALREKFAVSAEASSGGAEGAKSGGDKNSLAADDKMVANDEKPVGTTIAPVSPLMQSHADPHPSQTHSGTWAVEAAGGISGSAAGTDLGAASSSGKPDAAATAHQAVAAALEIADAQATRGDQAAHSVNLNLKFGEDTLGIRVEMRGGEVRTQFVTDSAELRSALSAEWGATTNSSPSRDYHLAAPEFSGSNGGSMNFSSDAGSSYSQSRGSQDFATSTDGGFGSGFSGSAEPALATAAPDPAPSAASTARYLQTFA